RAPFPSQDVVPDELLDVDTVLLGPVLERAHEGRRKAYAHGLARTVVGGDRWSRRPSALRFAEVRAAHEAFVPRQLARRTVESDLAFLHHVRAARELQRAPDVLLDEEHRHAAVGELGDAIE